MRPPRRHPLIWLALIVLTIALGLGSRRFGYSLPYFVAEYAGDTLWALLAFLCVGLLLPNVSTWRAAALAMTFSVLIESSQLYHAPWIDSVRHTTLGGLVLGFGFVGSDLACYTVGVGMGVIFDVTSRIRPVIPHLFPGRDSSDDRTTGVPILEGRSWRGSGGLRRNG